MHLITGVVSSMGFDRISRYMIFISPLLIWRALPMRTTVPVWATPQVGLVVGFDPDILGLGRVFALAQKVDLDAEV